MSVIAVTGADGFVGRAVCGALAARGHEARPLSRDRTCAEHFSSFGLETAAPLIVGDVDATTDWRAALADVDAVIHLAARVHVMRETAADPLAAFRAVNTAGTAKLAEAAAASGVGRVVLISTIKVNGERTDGRAPFGPDDVPAPEDPYALSKFEAEQALREVADRTALEAVAVRPPLVHGPGVGGNLLRLMRWVERGIPLPLAGIDNRRSLIGVDNLADVLVACAVQAEAAGRVFTVSDGEDLSTAGLVAEIAAGLGRPARLFRFPLGAAARVLRLAGRGAALGRLADSLAVDDRAVRRILDWTPPLSAREGLRKMTRWYGANTIEEV